MNEQLNKCLNEPFKKVGIWCEEGCDVKQHQLLKKSVIVNLELKSLP